jgi:hypothetical protein
MPSKLNLFPAHVAIGAVQQDGSVLMSPEFARALSSLMVRVGGPSALSLDEITVLFGSEPTAAAAVGDLSNDVAQLAQQVAGNQEFTARMAHLERRVEDLARLVNSTGPTPIDWEHPGRLGDKTPNSARVTTLNKITFTQPATAATFTLSDGKTFTATNSIALAGVDGKTLTLSNTLGFSGTDGAFLNIGTGGTLGSAAYASSGSFAARTNTALAPVATDAASTQALANSMRAALLSVGIGT